VRSGDDVLGILAEIAERPIDEWPQLLASRFPDHPAMVPQALLWLRAGLEKAEDDAAPPSLGKLGDERYELTLRLASGATATVWRARDRKLDRNVAIKVFHGRSDGTSIELQEARAACDVISDHVVRVLDVHDGGVRPYIVMELVAEHDAQLDELALGAAASSCRPASVQEAARWVMDVARGVHDAHLRNVFHRDLKPENVLITPISRRARIADFGLALSAATDQLGRSSSVLVKRGAAGPVSIAGTPEYMSPEQARGLPINLDPLHAEERKLLVGIDVWGLGALAYDLLSGRPPWLATSGGGDEPWEVAASGASPPPLHCTRHGAPIPAPLRRILEKAMAPKLADRYTSAGHVAGELEAFLARRPTSLDRSYAVRAALWCRRNPQLTMAGVVALILATLTLATYSSVVRLREERFVLTAKVARQRNEEDAIKARASQTRAELEKTKNQLKDEVQELSVLENDLEDEKKTYAAVLAAKDKALNDAGAATRELVDELTAARNDRRTMESERALYKQFWETARADGERIAKDRDQARNDREAARAAREAMKKERDAVSVERDQARAERDLSGREIARLTAALAAANARLSMAGNASRAGIASEASLDAGGAGPGPSDAGINLVVAGPPAAKSVPAGSAGTAAPARQRVGDPPGGQAALSVPADARAASGDSAQ
jgi:hypothetical protein